MYARKRDRMLLEEQWNRKQVHMMDPTSFILKNLDDIDSCKVSLLLLTLPFILVY